MAAAMRKVAEEVRSFYEQHPYPPPASELDAYRRRWQDPQLRRAEHRLYWPASPFRQDFSILVAGCGTVQAAKYALRWPEAEVTGIDFSRASIRCTEQLKRRYKLDKLQLHELPVERAGELGTAFDCVVCTGVLHHLADPAAGLAALRRVLAPGAAMHLMLYAPYGRAGVYMMQEFCRRLGIAPTGDGIRELIAVLGALPAGHPLADLLRQAPDFRDQAGMADALLHPQDRAYSVPELFDFLERGGLRFGRWLKQAAYSPRCGALARLALGSRMAQLPEAQQYAATELFRGTMVRHSVIAYANDSPPQRPLFAADAWLGYRPIRMPDTICIQQRLPPGAAAVLINRNHAYPDLYLPVDAQEKQLFDAVDGELSIGEIVRRHGHADIAPALWERLWWYDQVVFDTSG